MDQPSANQAVVVGFVDLKTKRPQQKRPSRREETSASPVNMGMMLQELQYLKRQIKVLKANAAKDARVRFAAANALSAQVLEFPEAMQALAAALKA